MFSPALRHVVLAAVLLLSSRAAFAETRLALVIGQSNYRAVVALPNPANDAKAFSQLLGDAGFEVQTAIDLSQNEMREKIGEFAASVAAKGPDTVALVFYAGHGLQIDGENFLVPVDVDPRREVDIPLQAIRLNDVLNTLTSVPSKMRILLLDACRNNPFPDINTTAGHGLALVDARIGAPGTFISFSTSPGAEAEDGNGADSPYMSALLLAKEPGLSIEEMLRRVRVSVNKSTDGRQTPWDSSSLTDSFSFFPGPGVVGSQQPVAKRTVEDWRRDLRGKPVEIANAMIVADATDEAYRAFVELFAPSPLAVQAGQWLDRHRRMVAWNDAVLVNTAAAYHAFLVQYPDSDLAATARKLEQRLRYRPVMPAAVGASSSIVAAQGAAPAMGSTPAVNAALGPTCPCSTPPAPPRKVELPSNKHADFNPPKRVNAPSRRRQRQTDDDVVVYRRPPPVDYEPPAGPPVGVGIGFGGFGGGYRGGIGRSRGGY